MDHNTTAKTAQSFPTHHTRSALAFMQQFLVIGALVASLGWFFWWRYLSIWLATVGALTMLLGYVVVLAVEFVAVARVSRGDVVPAADPGALLAAWGQEIWVAPRVFCWQQPFRWKTLPDSDPDSYAAAEARQLQAPAVVFVHGFLCNRGFWLPWMRELRTLSIPYTSVNLEPLFDSIADYVPVVEEAVQRAERLTGLPPTLVCHSMGGLAARAWLAHGARAPQRVRQVITIGTPHHGTWISRFSHVPNGRQMRQNHEWLGALSAGEHAALATPYQRFVCWYSNADNIVFPASTAMLAGADNRHVPGVAHVALAFHPRVMRESLAMLASGASSPDARTAS
jgi:pimeloyl-ACP methyl ester carboxylesterase